MTEKPEYDTDEISLLDIYAFFRDGWKTLVALSILGLSVGITAAFVLPEKFQASALIEPAAVGRKGKEDTIESAVVETVAVLAEKMKVPTYYGEATIQACGLANKTNPAEALVKRLKPSVARNSAYVAITYKAHSPAAASACLESVLKDVIANQALLAQPLISNLESQLVSAQEELNADIRERDLIRKQNPEKLKIVRASLVEAQRFIETYSQANTPLRSADPQFSPSAILLPALIAKYAEVKDLEQQINGLELLVGANITSKDQAVRQMASKVSELKNALLPPSTKIATFAAPIYAPNDKVEPKRSVVILVGLVVGGFLGLLWLVGVRVRNNLRQQIQRQASHQA